MGKIQIVRSHFFLCSDVGVQIDGFISVAAHTHIVGTNAFPTTGKKADVICAAHVAAEAIVRLLKPGASVCYSFIFDSFYYCYCFISHICLARVGGFDKGMINE